MFVDDAWSYHLYWYCIYIVIDIIITINTRKYWDIALIAYIPYLSPYCSSLPHNWAWTSKCSSL